MENMNNFRQGSTLEYAVFRTETPQISTISPKTGNYTTPEEIGEMREILQVTKMAKKMPILSR